MVHHDYGYNQAMQDTHGYDPLIHPYLLFNLALASHCIAKQTASQVFLARAGLMYGALIRMLCDTIWRRDQALDVLAILAANNAAVLQHELGNHQECKMRFQEMEYQLRVSDIDLDTYLVLAEANALQLNVQQARPPSPLAPAA